MTSAQLGDNLGEVQVLEAMDEIASYLGSSGRRCCSPKPQTNMYFDVPGGLISGYKLSEETSKVHLPTFTINLSQM